MKEKENTLFKKSFKTPLDSSKHVPGTKDWYLIITSLSRKKKLILFGFIAVFIISTYSLLSTVSKRYFQDIPAHGGSFTEGIVGTPRYINPLLSTSDIDKDLSELIFSGLLKANPDGTYSPDLASSYTISEDGLTYTISLKENILWHDGKEVTAEDVAFTINSVKNELLKSPERANWLGVDVNPIDLKTIEFSLSNPYYPFLESLTLGIIPEHIWKDTLPEQMTFSPENLKPIGSGPYELKKVKRDGSGAIKSLELKSFDDFYEREPYISKINFNFYGTEDEALGAYLDNNIDSIGGLSPQTASWLERQEKVSLAEGTLPRVFAVFFNQNQAPVFLNQEVRSALEISIDKEALINTVLLGYGEIIDEPLAPPISLINTSIDTGTSTRITYAQGVLEKNGWKKNEEGIYEKTINKVKVPLAFSISTINSGDLKVAADELEKTWKNLGADIEMKWFERGDLNQDVIRPRKYDVLLFGQVTGRYPDPFAFWHSSQRLDPGLNVALYTNSTVDSILEDIRITEDVNEKEDLYKEFSEIISEEKPAIFLYSPNYVYLTPSKVMGIQIDTRSGSSGRFSNIEDWYIYSHKTWIH